MSETTALRQLMLDELEHGVKTTKRLLDKVKSEDWDYRPVTGMRTLLEVAHHLVLVPATDLTILQERSGDEVGQIEQAIRDIRDPKRLGNIMQEHFEKLQAYMTGLSDDEFLNKSTKAFYADHGQTQAKWLIEITTHTFHHRSQLFNYLKQLGYDINFFMLY